MSLNQIIDDNSGSPAEPWKNLKINDLNANSINFSSATVDDLTVNNTLTVDGLADLNGGVQADGLTTVTQLQVNSSSLFIGPAINANNGINFGQDDLNYYSSEIVSGLTLNANNGGTTLLDNDYQVKLTRIGDNVTLRFNKTINNSVAGATSLEIDAGIPLAYRPPNRSYNPVVLTVGGSGEVCIADIDNNGNVILLRQSGNFASGDGIDITTIGLPCVSYSIGN